VLCPESEFVEVVLGLQSAVVGKPMSEGPIMFQSAYRAGLVAVRRRATLLDPGVQDPEAANTSVADKGERGAFQLGDTVMLVAHKDVVLPPSDFLMVTRVGQMPRAVRRYDYIPLLLFVAGLGIAASDLKDMLDVSIMLMLIFVAGGWVRQSDYASAIDFRLLVLIGSSTGFSEAMSRSGLSKELANLMMIDAIPRWLILPLLFTLEVVLTEIVTNNAAVAIGLPLALDLCKEMGLKSHKPLTLAVMLGASVGFAMPMGYQTHLMVMGPGGYSVKDFLKFGIIMDLVWIIGVSLLLPAIYPLE
jgi:di/tricarboxylate transporter